MSRKEFPYLTIIVVAVITTAAIAWPHGLSAQNVLFVSQMYLLAAVVTALVVCVMAVGRHVYERIRERRSRHPDDYNSAE